MTLVQKYFFCVRLLIVILSVFFAMIGCGGEKKKAALWPLALLGSGSGTSGGQGTGTSATTGNGTTTGGGTGNSASGIPKASLSVGHYSTPQTISFSSTAIGGVVKCTTNNTDPTNATETWTPKHIWSLAGLTIKCGTFVNGSLVDTIQSFTYSYSPLQSGQSISYAADDDGDTRLGVIRSYTNNGDGTVRDNATGLLWQSCSFGLSGASCASGAVQTPDWATAQTNCASLATVGKIWRLTSISELETLLDYGASGPSINVIAFPSTVTHNYWTSTTNAFNTTNAWIANFAVGNIGSSPKSTSNLLVRCVSGEAQASFPKFKDNGDGTIYDKQTSLTWQKCSQGQANDTTCTGTASTYMWANAITTCSSLSLVGKVWRLPSFRELRTLVDTSVATAPSINTAFFPSTVSNNYWTSTTYTPSTTNAWIVDFGTAINGNYSKTNNYQTRCVSGP